MSRINKIISILENNEIEEFEESVQIDDVEDIQSISESSIITKGLRKVKYEGAELIETFIKILADNFNVYMKSKKIEDLYKDTKPVFDKINDAINYAYGGNLVKTTALLAGLPYSILTEFFSLLSDFESIDFNTGNKYDFDDYVSDVNRAIKENPNLISDIEKSIQKSFKTLESRLNRYKQVIEEV